MGSHCPELCGPSSLQGADLPSGAIRDYQAWVAEHGGPQRRILPLITLSDYRKAQRNKGKLSKAARRAERKRLGIEIAPPARKQQAKKLHTHKRPKWNKKIEQFKVIGLPNRRNPSAPKWRPPLNKKPQKSLLERRADAYAANPTKAEQILKDALSRRSELHFCFNRILGPFIPDFYFPDAKLIVECDGKHHREDGEQVEHDSNRDRYFARLGIDTLRFTNAEIRMAPEAVIKRILRRIDKHSQPAREQGVSSQGIGTSPNRRRASGARPAMALPVEATTRWKPGDSLSVESVHG